MSLLQFLNDKVGKRLNTEANTTMIIVGDPRSGKSTWAFHLARAWARTFGQFNDSANVHFYARDLLKDFDKATRTAIILDDAGYQSDPTRWYSKTARAIKIIQETQGIKLNFLLITVQSLGLLLEHNTQLSTYLWDIRQKGRAKLYKIIPKHFEKGFWFINMHWVFDFSRLNDDAWKQYEAKKMEFLGKSTIEMDKEMQMEEMRREIRYRKQLLTISKLSGNYEGVEGGGLTPYQKRSLELKEKQLAIKEKGIEALREQTMKLSR